MARILPTPIARTTTQLSKADHALIRKKQDWLQTYYVRVPNNSPHLQRAVSTTLVFAQDCAGTAVCISEEGLLLTCSHCVAESEEEYLASREAGTTHWLVFAGGMVVEARCEAWHPRADLALLRVVGAQEGSRIAGEAGPAACPTRDAMGSESDPINIDDSIVSEAAPSFPFIELFEGSPPKKGRRLICIGHPGSEDLEVDTPGVQTNYDVLHVSPGRFQGYAQDQDPLDNADIGALMHDCWTYWGHSGAPLVDRGTGLLVGLHTSWDEETGMRRGIGPEAMRDFLRREGIIA